MKKYVTALFLLLLSKTSLAQYAFSQNEVIRLPPFCRGLSIGNFQENAKHLKRNIKVPGEHTQHFCHGMKAILRKEYATAVQEFEYVQHHSKNKHALTPATSLYKAEALGKLDKIAPALEEYNKAIKLKNDYSHAYAKLSDYYLKLKQPKNAMDTLNMGLKFSPNSKLLKRRLKKLKKNQ